MKAELQKQLEINAKLQAKLEEYSDVYSA